MGSDATLTPMTGLVVAVHRSPTHTMAKASQPTIRLLAGLGVADDAHAGVTVKHRSRVARDPSQPNLRQVHLIQAELHHELAERGMPVEYGRMGENVTTRGVDLLALPTGSRLRLGPSAIVEVTGVRNPCLQLEGIHSGLMQAVLGRHADGALIRRAGVMGIVLVGGEVGPGDAIEVILPDLAHPPLGPV
jgi:MOSC domain-containing protein YiiM